MGPPGCGVTRWRVHQVWPHIPIYAGSIAPGFHSHRSISYKIVSLVWQCLSGWAPSYLCELCHPLYSCAGRSTLRSSAHSDLVVPFACSATMQSHSFSVVGPTTWNGLPLDLKHLPKGACSQFYQLLKTVLFRLAWSGVPLSRDLEGPLYKYLLIDWFIDIVPYDFLLPSIDIAYHSILYYLIIASLP